MRSVLIDCRRRTTGHSSVAFTLDRYGHLYERKPATKYRTAWVRCWALAHPQMIPKSVNEIPGSPQEGFGPALLGGGPTEFEPVLPH